MHLNTHKKDPTAARAALGCGDEVPVLGSLEAALLHCYSGGDSKNIAQVFVIGGGELYKVWSEYTILVVEEVVIFF
jgi:dihydrofolate reductase